MTDGNLAALNQYLAEQDKAEQEENFEHEKRMEEAEQVMEELRDTGYMTYKIKGLECKRTIFDILCDATELEMEEVNNILFAWLTGNDEIHVDLEEILFDVVYKHYTHFDINDYID